MAQVILDDEYAHAGRLSKATRVWAMDLFNHGEGSLDRFLEEV